MLAIAVCSGGASMARADDPNDPSMRNPANRARDKAIIRDLNLGQLAYVEKRDAEYAEGWKAWREYKRRGQNGRLGADGAEDYASARARYQRDMAAWRRAVSLCEAGRYEYCDRR
ncbi:hypothetical protein [Novosphingobium sp.]|uniref:hypothetical protein n=1 Tax=Novosphingobium sp. TaxID=1874826 RepID=UPI00286D9ECF|nr:hypothetical protein [Novosphingobium sp.]